MPLPLLPQLLDDRVAPMKGRWFQRDLPYYAAAVTPEFVAGMTEFQRNVGLIKGTPKYEDVVATQFTQYWV